MLSPSLLDLQHNALRLALLANIDDFLDYEKPLAEWQKDIIRANARGLARLMGIIPNLNSKLVTVGFYIKDKK